MTIPDGDMLGGIVFVKVLTVYDLPTAERIRDRMRAEGVGAVIINDEEYQARPPEERAKAKAGAEGFRIEVPEPLLSKAREILAKIQEAEAADNDE